MSKPYLVIVESPGKIKKLKAILGAEYEIVASMGHVIDLPRTTFGIDLATMQPAYEVMKADVAKRLRTEAQKPYKVIYLASDPDREGEAISHHIAGLLKRAKTTARLERVTFDAITPSAVKGAFSRPRTLDMHLVAAQETRRLLDRLVGFPASRFLWQFVQGHGLSARRVQSVALRLVVERDHAIETFTPEEYWTIGALFQAARGAFSAKLTDWQGKRAVLKTKADADAVLTALKGVAYQIQSVSPKQREQIPTAPFTTSSLQQAASSYLKLPPEVTMKLAQQLYEAGHITYMRTDSPAVSLEGSEMAKNTIEALYGARYSGRCTYIAKGNAQEAHECVRPTDTADSPVAVRLSLGGGGGQAADLYDLIYKRFLASQMANAVFNEVHVKVTGGKAVFSAKGSQLVFDGFLRVYQYSEEKEQAKREDDMSDEDEPSVNKTLPALKAGEAVEALKLMPTQHFTKPPSAYTEALLVKALEQNGVGRPSTYAQTIANIKERGYVAVETGKLAPTTLGRQVHSVLDTRLKGLFETAFTAQMETALDTIATGQQNGREYLRGFWAQVSPLFGAAIIQAPLGQKETAAVTEGTFVGSVEISDKSTAIRPRPLKAWSQATTAQSTDATTVTLEYGVCSQCHKPLLKRNGPRGAFMGWAGFPKCRFTRPVS